MIYLASPYSHPDPAVREQRFRAACQVAADMMRQGEQVFSPIAHTHPIAEFGLPKGWEFWEKFDRWFIERCEEFAILEIDGWKTSKGIRAEMALTVKYSKPVTYIDPSYIGSNVQRACGPITQHPDAGEESGA